MRPRLATLFVTVFVLQLTVTFAQQPVPPQNIETGVTDKVITIGTLVPAKGVLSSMGAVVKSLVVAYCEELNSKGGINGRKFEVKFVETGSTPAETKANVERMIRESHIFALLSPITAGADKEILAVTREQGIPMIGPLTLYPDLSPPLNRQTFYVLSGLETQARAFVDFAQRNDAMKGKGVGIVSTGGERDAPVVNAIQEQLKKRGAVAGTIYPITSAKTDGPQFVKQVSMGKNDLIFFLGSQDDAILFLKEAARILWYPHIYLAGGGGNAILDLPIGFDEKVFLAFSTAPVDQTEFGVSMFSELTSKYKIEPNNRASQLIALAAAQIFAEGITRAGKNLTRESLIQSLETLSNFTTGLTQPISYSPTRRIGAQGAYIIKLDLKARNLALASDWLPVN